MFLIYVNDLHSNVINELLKFADDGKLFGCVDNTSVVNSIQDDLFTLENWSKEWLMLFNTDKCKVMHFGTNNPKYVYKLKGVNLCEVDEDVDRGVHIHNRLKVSS